MKRVWAGLAVLVVVVVVVVIAAGLYLRSHQTPPIAAAYPPVASSSMAEAPKPPQSVAESATPVAATVTPVPAVPPAPAPAPAPTELKFQRVDIDTAKPNAEACLIFSQPLDAAVKYEEYLAFTPAMRPAMRIDGSSLCLSGLAFGVNYQTELRAGLPAANGLKLLASQKITVGMRDRPPLIAFRDGLILPRENSAGVPINTINVNRLKLQLFRVPERLLSQISGSTMAERQTYPYDVREMSQSRGAKLWEGEMDVKAAHNETATTLFPLRDVLKDTKPGVYVLVADDAAQSVAGRSGDDDDDFSRSEAIQWVVDSDIALTSFDAADGLHVYARSLSKAEPMAGITLSLVANNNEELAKAVTDADGQVHFDPGLSKGEGALGPDLVMAFGADGDFTFQDVTRPAFDLSDRGVDGRALPGPVDAFVYTERGIYRPRETVQIVTLLRDRLANAMPGTPITLKIMRPDGATYRRTTVADQANGAIYYPLTLTDTAPRGRWTIEAYIDPKGDAVGKAEFDVQDFIPQRLKVTVTSEAPFLKPGDGVMLDAEARFLYGAPAAGLDGEAEATITADRWPFTAYRGFQFGLAQQRFEEKIIPLKVEDTDAEGKTKITGALTDIPETTLPLKASIRVSIFEPGGRSTNETISLPLRARSLMLGVHPLFAEDRVQEDTAANFEIVALDEAGKPVAKSGIDYALVREVTEYTWYKVDRGYRYEHATHDVPVVDGSLEVPADKAASFSHVLPWGYYRLTVSDKASGAATSYRFSSGWSDVLAEDRPDKAEVSADKPKYAIGDTAHISIRPPAAGTALLVIASDRILAQRLVTVPADGATVDVPVTKDWGTGAYAIVAAYRPVGDGSERAPIRAIGLKWLQIDPAARTLTVDVTLPDKTLPRHKLDVPVTVKGAAGDKAYVTLAAVDEGILLLTKFASPNPADFYFGKRRLAVDMRDDYGRLIDPRGTVGTVRSGGDIGGRALDVVPTKTVALFSGIIALDASGHASIPVDIPDFNGDLRFMAVAFDAEKVGEAEAHLIVRDPVVGDVTVPRFLAPNDKSRLSLDLHNVDGAPGTYHVKFAVSGAIAMADTSRDVELKNGERKLYAFALDGKDSGIGTIDLHLTGPGNFSVDRQWQIAVRPAQLPISHDSVVALGAGKETTLDPQMLNEFLPGTGLVTVSFDSIRTVPLAGLLRSLDRYPFGCVEQTTSRAYPLMYFNDVALVAGEKGEKSAEGRVQEAIDHILDMQRSDGNFGLWAARGDEAKDWLSVYALDFLTAATAKQYHIPNEALERGRNWLRKTVQSKETEVRTRFYASYVLARTEGVSLPDLRYIYDTNQTAKGNNAFAQSQLGTALTLEGDRARAQAAFVHAEKLPLTPRNQPLFHVYDNTDYYGSALRDWAGFLTMAAEAGETDVMARLYDRFQWVNEDADDLTTQEKAWMLLAMNAIAKQRGPISLQVNGETVTAKDHAVNLTPDKPALAKGYAVRNTSDRDVWETVSLSGIPTAPLGAESKGVTLTRGFWTLGGKGADLSSVQQNDRLIVTLRGATADNRHHEMALLDLLPAGFEIEGLVKTDDDGKTAYSWLGNMRALRLTETRDDRFVASFVVHPDDRSVTVEDADKEKTGDYVVAYIVRAITPGIYVLPAATISDMYRPAVTARTEMGSVTITPRE